MADLKGLTLPIEKGWDGYFTPRNRSDVLKESIRMILSVRPGEYINEPEFGSQLKDLLFDPNDELTQSRAKAYVTEAVRQWDDRIDVSRIDITVDGEKIYLQVEYYDTEEQLPDKVEAIIGNKERIV